jgi:hypothetical protein
MVVLILIQNINILKGNKYEVLKLLIIVRFL